MFQRQQIRVYSRECLTYCVVTSFKQSELAGLARNKSIHVAIHRIGFTFKQWWLLSR